MKLSLFHKFSISILSICVLGMAFVWLSTRLLFEDSFLDYINKQREQSMALAVERLASHYEENGNWQQLVNRHRTWRQLASGNQQNNENPRRHQHLDNWRPPPLDYARGPGRPDHNSPHRLSPRQGPEPGPLIELTLVDVQGNYITGHRPLMDNPDRLSLAIKYNDQAVGFLIGRKQTRIVAAIDQNFAESLNRSVLIVLSFSLVFTLFVATLLARHLSRPIKNLSKATHELSQGHYETRMPTDRTDEIGQLSEDFNQLAKTLEASRHSQQRWIADISHELRTPLAILKGELMAIEDGVRQFDDASLQSLISETDRFSRLVNDLYDLSRADTGDLDYQMEPVDLMEVLGDVTQMFSHRFAEKNIQLSVNGSDNKIPVVVDLGRIKQLFSNLLENSLRYTDAEGQTRIECQKKKEHALVTVEDSLPGVPENLFNKIFKRLYRVEHSRSRLHGGGGLGLALCKTIVEAHKGCISAEKSSLGGLKIRILLPCS